MAMINSSRVRVRTQMPTTTTRWKERETSPERTKVWSEPIKPPHPEKKVPVVYYLSRNGQLEHPHFIEVPLLSSSPGLYLRDVISRLDIVRGNGMANLYSWSSKRRYKNGFVWHDLAENDFIYPAHGQEYVLKGSEILLDGALICRSDETAMSFSSRRPVAVSPENGDDSEFPAATRRRNQSWCATDFHDDYRVYKSEPTSSELTGGRIATDASTQTEDKRRRRQAVSATVMDDHEKSDGMDETTELNTAEISPPPSDSSPETLESLMNTNSRLIFPGRTVGVVEVQSHVASCQPTPMGRLRAPSVLMQLISCGSGSFSESEPTNTKKNDDGNGRVGCSLGVAQGPGGTDLMDKGTGNDAGHLEEKEKESMSSSRLLMETKQEQLSIFKRWSSNAADEQQACSSIILPEIETEEEEEGTNCMHRRKSKSSLHSSQKTK